MFCLIRVFIFVFSVGLFFFSLIKYGEFFSIKFGIGVLLVFCWEMVVIIRLLVVIYCIWFDRQVDSVVLLFLQCLICVVCGVMLVSIIFFIVLWVMLMFLLFSVVVFFSFVFFGLNILRKNGVQVWLKLIIFFCLVFLLRLEIIRFILLVCRYGMWLVLVIGISCSLSFIDFVRQCVILMLYFCGCRLVFIELNGGKFWGMVMWMMLCFLIFWSWLVCVVEIDERR